VEVWMAECFSVISFVCKNKGDGDVKKKTRNPKELDTQQIYYVYEWYIIETNEVFYVGKGKLNRAKQLKKENLFFMKMYDSHNTNYRIVFDCLSEEAAFAMEIKLIHLYRADFPNYRLTNIQDGGNQPPIYEGEECGASKYSKKSILQVIAYLVNTIVPITQIAVKLKVDKSTIYNIYYRISWNSLTKGLVFKERLDRGENKHNSKLTEKQALTIIDRLLNKESCETISNDFNINRRSINDIRIKSTWKHLTENITFPIIEGLKGSTNGMAVLSESDVINIRTRLNDGEKGITLAKEYKVTSTLISRIKLNKCWNHVKVL